MKLVITSVKDKKSAKELANALLEQKAAACVNILKANSLYFWQDKFYDDKERILIIKTDKKFKEIVRFIKENHDYELPEIICLKVKNTEKRYKKWVKNQTKGKK